MNRLKRKLLTVGLSVVVLGGLLGKLAIDHHLPWQSAEANSGSAERDNSLENDKTHWRAKITFQEALRIAETAIGGKAYSIERETESGKPVIEVGIAGQEVFVDAENGKIVLIDNLRQKGDRDDLAEIAKALKLQKLTTLPIQTALQAGESFTGKQAHVVALKSRDGKPVYEVGVGLQEIFIDPNNGQVLSTATVGQTEENQ